MAFFSLTGLKKIGTGEIVFAHVAQLAEHVLGKDEVTGSSPVMGSIIGLGRSVVVGQLSKLNH